VLKLLNKVVELLCIELIDALQLIVSQQFGRYAYLAQAACAFGATAVLLRCYPLQVVSSPVKVVAVQVVTLVTVRPLPMKRSAHKFVAIEVRMMTHRRAVTIASACFACSRMI